MSKFISNVSFEKAITDVVTDLSKNMYEIENYTDEQIANLFDLSEEEAVELEKVINDELIAENKVYSNKKTEERLTEIQAEMSTYVNEQIAGSGTLKRKIVADESEVIDEQYLYLILTDADNSVYTQYMLIDGVATALGSTTVDMDGYVKEEELTTTLEDYAKANEVLKADSVVNDLTAPTNDTVLSTQGISDELANYVKVADIDTELDVNSTNAIVNSVVAEKFEEIQTAIDGIDFPVDDELDATSTNAIQNKVVAEALDGIMNTYISISDLNTRKGLSISLVANEDNTQQIIDALDAKEQFIEWFGNSNNRFGINPEKYGDRINEIRIVKTSETNAVITAFMNSGVTLSRLYTGSDLKDWCVNDVPNEILHADLSDNLAGITTVLDLVNALVTEHRATSPKKPVRYVNGTITKTTLTDLPQNYGLLQITVSGNDVVEISFAGSSYGFKTLYLGFVNRTSGETLFSSITWQKIIVENSSTDPYSCTGYTVLTGTEDLFTLVPGHYATTKADTTYNYPITDSSSVTAHIYVLGCLNDPANNKGYRIILYFDNKGRMYRINEWWGSFSNGWQQIASTSDYNMKTYTNVTQLGLSSPCSVIDIIKALPKNSYLIYGSYGSETHNGGFITDAPANHGLLEVKKSDYDGCRATMTFTESATNSMGYKRKWIAEFASGNGNIDTNGVKWHEVAYKAVADVGFTTINQTNGLTAPTGITMTDGSKVNYCIRNGICYVHIALQISSISAKVNSWTTIAELPKSVIEAVGAMNCESNTVPECMPIRVSQAGKLTLMYKGTTTSTSDWWSYSFSYPVTE